MGGPWTNVTGRSGNRHPRTDPTRADTDNDGVSDAAEVTAGTDPLIPDNGDATLSGVYLAGQFRNNFV